VRIDHFVEVTMAAFYRVAQAVQPITVCLNQATADTFSGANFAAGMQQIDAAQAMAFVRQRRDTQYENVDLTDLDRTRRQQAFMISLAVKLKSAQTFTDFGAMRSLIDTAKQYVAIDQGFDLLSLASTAQRLAGGDITFQTLPVERFGTIDGESVNIVDQDKIAGIVRDLLNPPSPTAAPTDAPPTRPTRRALPPTGPTGHRRRRRVADPAELHQLAAADGLGCGALRELTRGRSIAARPPGAVLSGVPSR
jgi:anionic cell wall polymer biosynthesis LytR-Cps2A-Psr (LCP) family protein